MVAEYSIVRFSPAPELVETTNVALVFWEPRPRLVFEPTFPRLACLAPETDLEMLRFYLESLAEMLTSMERPTPGSSQFEFSQRRQIAQPITNYLEKMLMAKYLLRHSTAPHRYTADREERVTSQLQTFLTRRLGVPPQDILKRATPKEFLSANIVNKHFAENSLRVARVVSGQRTILVADAINRHISQIEQIERRAMRIGSAFYRLGKAKKDVEVWERKKLVRAVIFFGEGDPKAAGRLEYVEDSLRRDAEYVEEAKSPHPEFSAIARASADLLF